jgi:hypothetical protein
MVVHLTVLLLLTEIVIIGHGQELSLEKSRMHNAAHAVKLPPCQACKVLVDSFKKVRLILQWYYCWCVFLSWSGV